MSCGGGRHKAAPEGCLDQKNHVAPFQPPPEGWFTFGTHVDQIPPGTRLLFSEESGEDSLPLWEKPVPKDQTEQQERALTSILAGVVASQLVGSGFGQEVSRVVMTADENGKFVHQFTVSFASGATAQVQVKMLD